MTRQAGKLIVPHTKVLSESETRLNFCTVNRAILSTDTGRAEVHYHNGAPNQRSSCGLVTVTGMMRIGPTPTVSDHVINLSREKLEAVSKLLIPWFQSPHVRPVTSPDDAVKYRCRCSFQILPGYTFAIRHDHHPVPIAEFPIANVRIQHCMRELLSQLCANDAGVLGQRLTSISFSTSWLDSPGCDCIITMNYSGHIANVETWTQQARSVGNALGVSQILGRSHRKVHYAYDDRPATLRDCLVVSSHEDWKVDAVELTFPGTDSKDVIVQYEKPDGAFFHPNVNVMREALQWLLQRVSRIAELRSNGKKPVLFELYCGCGAHTMALAKSMLLDHIVAVEVDERLVDAFRRNCELNGLSSTVRVLLHDAGKVKFNESFDILLVDPPKQGLDDRLCQWAVGATFEHLLYISCGYEALLRDLKHLEASFDVQDCVILDLFPGTGSVEILAHLTRR